MKKRANYILLTFLLLLALLLRFVVLSDSDKEEYTGTIFVKETAYAEERI